MDVANSSFTPIITTATQSCTRKSTTNFLNSPLSCSTSASFDKIFLTGSFNNTALSGTTLSFSISNILSPPTNAKTNYITVSTLTDGNNQIDQSTCIIDPVNVKSISGVSSTVQLTVGTSS